MSDHDRVMEAYFRKQSFKQAVREAISEASFETNFTRFCRTEAFKQYVHNAVNNEMFWRNIFSDMRINDQVDRRITNELPRQVQSQLNTLLPGMVSREILNQLPGILSNNYQMQQILAQHKDNLKVALEAAASEILNRIVNEDEYHEVNKAYFDAFNRRADDQISRFNTRANDTLTGINRRVERDLSNLTQSLSQVNNLQTNMAQLQSRVEQSENQIFWLKAIGVTLIALSYPSYIFFRYHF